MENFLIRRTLDLDRTSAETALKQLVHLKGLE
jgi:hypothetical protein